MRKVLILTDQKGWHYRQLKKSFENKNISVESANLDDLSITINNNKNQIVKNNGEILSDITDVFVRHIPGGIAVALMGRNHPIGIIIAALLFGILYQGGMDLAFEMQNVSRHIIVVMQGLVILFCGGLEYLYRPILIRFLAPIET